MGVARRAGSVPTIPRKEFRMPARKRPKPSPAKTKSRTDRAEVIRRGGSRQAGRRDDPRSREEQAVVGVFA